MFNIQGEFLVVNLLLLTIEYSFDTFKKKIVFFFEAEILCL